MQTFATRALCLFAMLAPLATQADIYRVDTVGGRVTLTTIHRSGLNPARVAREPARKVSQPRAAVSGRRYRLMVAQAAFEYGLPADLLHAVIKTESNYNPSAVSPRGAAGLMQLMPDTARNMGVKNVFDPAQNIRGGARYLKRLMRQFNNDLSLALAAYNAGPAAVHSAGRAIPPYPETQRYVPSVLKHYERLQASAKRAR
ncbi:lytic transglycosylase domain-containing protein [Metapseudomonas boanensis]|uniref:Lytic transglycosylase domain-containing protein n=1 Tax=Metapseudomonas boanensis TaxID=2822138 RepID=A0ABS5XGF1_9GAMM|nr:lytic transglycosylase domain-containing protein [Pseudomonas boanensis]MBT8765422.1 lytic transglycosylase domain-containing protein [Pseudomonas boanensis]